MKTYRQKLGNWGERTAAGYLESKGYAIIDRNARTPYGEIDLIAIDKSGAEQITTPSGDDPGVVVFIEVKTRTSTRYGLPEEAITPAKRDHLTNAILAYMQTHSELPGTWRVDVIAILRARGVATPEITHFANALA